MDSYMMTERYLNVSFETGIINVDAGFIHGYISSLAMIVVSEIGDKTFLIAVVMSMKYSRLAVFAGAVLALALMTFLSALSGCLLASVPAAVIRYASAGVFAGFGLRLLKESWTTRTVDSFQEVESEVRVKLEEGQVETQKDPESGVGFSGGSPSRVFLEAFSMTLLAELGDRSQVATLLLAAREDIRGVTCGAILGHALCTGLAVVGGRMIAKRISVRTVTIFGGLVFLTFAVLALFS